ncbi:MAG: penicillin-insensitive murein endopeptidase [Polyangiaceae bacterium]|nr:penicillin-insensitive murein endopeptidase [Polyangiaceae bacterium]
MIPRLLALAALAFALAGCVAQLPTPLAPALRGSIGVPHDGVVTGAAELPKQGEGYVLLRSKGARWGNPRLVAAIQAAARDVARARPGGAPLVVGDLSAQRGGRIHGHRSHRTGRDADLLFYLLTPDGRSSRSPGFLRFAPDALAEVAPTKDAPAPSAGADFLRLDVERNWLLVKALVASEQANVQWLFVARWIEALIIEYALARGEDPELVWQAESVLLQPGDSAAHDDHIHMRVACTPDEAVAGCLGGGPYWPWLPALPQLTPQRDIEMVTALVGDLLPGAAPVAAGAVP